MSNKYEAALGPFNDGPDAACQCWSSRAYTIPFHRGHCCYVAGATCHEREGNAIAFSADIGDPR